MTTEQKREYSRKWRAKNPEKIIGYITNQKQAKADKACRGDDVSRLVKNHPRIALMLYVQFLEGKIARRRTQNRDRNRQFCRRYYFAHKEQLRAREKKWAAANREKCRLSVRKYRAKVRELDNAANFVSTISSIKLITKTANELIESGH